LAGPLEGPSAYFMKSPPRQYTDHDACELTRAFVRDEDATPAPRASA
jgi:myo-inositol-1-phosphate synthase